MNIREYPIVTVNLETDLGAVTHVDGVVPHLVHNAIIGRAFPKFWELWEYPVSVTVTEAEPESLAGVDNLASGDSSQGSPGFPFSVIAGELEESEEVTTANESRKPSADTEATLDFADLYTHNENFGTEQREDPTLARAWENVLLINNVIKLFSY